MKNMKHLSAAVLALLLALCLALPAATGEGAEAAVTGKDGWVNFLLICNEGMNNDKGNAGERFDSMPILNKKIKKGELISLLLGWCNDEVSSYKKVVADLELREKLISFRDAISQSVIDAIYPYGKEYKEASRIYLDTQYSVLFETFAELSERYRNEIHHRLQSIDSYAKLYDIALKEGSTEMQCELEQKVNAISTKYIKPFESYLSSLLT